MKSRDSKRQAGNTMQFNLLRVALDSIPRAKLSKSPKTTKSKSSSLKATFIAGSHRSSRATTPKSRGANNPRSTKKSRNLQRIRVTGLQTMRTFDDFYVQPMTSLYQTSPGFDCYKSPLNDPKPRRRNHGTTKKLAINLSSPTLHGNGTTTGPCGSHGDFRNHSASCRDYATSSGSIRTPSSTKSRSRFDEFKKSATKIKLKKGSSIKFRSRGNSNGQHGTQTLKRSRFTEMHKKKRGHRRTKSDEDQNLDQLTTENWDRTSSTKKQFAHSAAVDMDNIRYGETPESFSSTLSIRSRESKVCENKLSGRGTHQTDSASRILRHREALKGSIFEDAKKNNAKNNRSSDHEDIDCGPDVVQVSYQEKRDQSNDSFGSSEKEDVASRGPAKSLFNTRNRRIHGEKQEEVDLSLSHRCGFSYSLSQGDDEEDHDSCQALHSKHSGSGKENLSRSLTLEASGLGSGGFFRDEDFQSSDISAREGVAVGIEEGQDEEEKNFDGEKTDFYANQEIALEQEADTEISVIGSTPDSHKLAGRTPTDEAFKLNQDSVASSQHMVNALKAQEGILKGLQEGGGSGGTWGNATQQGRINFLFATQSSDYEGNDFRASYLKRMQRELQGIDDGSSNLNHQQQQQHIPQTGTFSPTFGAMLDMGSGIKIPNTSIPQHNMNWAQMSHFGSHHHHHQQQGQGLGQRMDLADVGYIQGKMPHFGNATVSSVTGSPTGVGLRPLATTGGSNTHGMNTMNPQFHPHHRQAQMNHQQNQNQTGQVAPLTSKLDELIQISLLGGQAELLPQLYALKQRLCGNEEAPSRNTVTMGNPVGNDVSNQMRLNQELKMKVNQYEQQVALLMDELKVVVALEKQRSGGQTHG